MDNIPKIEKLQEELTLKIEDREINGYDDDLRVAFSRALYIFNTGDASVSFSKPKMEGEECRLAIGVWVADCSAFLLEGKKTHKINLTVDESLISVADIDSFDLTLMSSTFYIKFKIKFSLPTKY